MLLPGTTPRGMKEILKEHSKGIVKPTTTRGRTWTQLRAASDPRFYASPPHFTLSRPHLAVFCWPERPCLPPTHHLQSRCGPDFDALMVFSYVRPCGGASRTPEPLRPSAFEAAPQASQQSRPWFVQPSHDEPPPAPGGLASVSSCTSRRLLRLKRDAAAVSEPPPW